MKKLAFGALFVGLLVAAGCGGDDKPHVVLPDGAGSATTCNPLTQAGCAAGEKCTWLLDALMPQYVGHVGCVADGTGAAGDSCTFGAPGTTGFDNCKKGLVCGNYRGGTDVCKTICDQAGGMPDCGSTHVCVTYSDLFSTGDTTPAAAGVCDLACDPFADNDFDGSGTQSMKTASTCGGSAASGCYGYPSLGTPPATGWSCTHDINNDVAQDTGGFRHRVECTVENKCAGMGLKIYVNSCNQGYLPLLRESTMVSTTICVAMCKPLDCYLGNCGAGNPPVNMIGQAPNRCNGIDRIPSGNFAAQNDAAWNARSGEHCQYLWHDEIDMMNNYLPSPTSDTMGFCFDHMQYQFDSNGDNMADKTLPPCSILASGFGSGSDPSMLNYWGAADLGCESTTSAGIGSAAGKPGRIPESAMRKRAMLDLPRALYHRTMGSN